MNVLLQLSQILGHSDQLYTKLPRGVGVWQYSNAIAVTGLAAAVSRAYLFAKHSRINAALGEFRELYVTVQITSRSFDSDRGVMKY